MALRVLIYRIVILSDKYRLSLSASNALLMRAVGRVEKINRHTDGETGSVDQYLSVKIMAAECHRK